MQPTSNNSVCILRLPDVIKRTGLKRSSIYARVKEGSFPRHVSLGARSVGWVESEIEAWIADRINTSRKPVQTA